MKKLILQLIWFVYNLKSRFNYFFNKSKNNISSDKLRKKISENVLFAELNETDKIGWTKRLEDTLVAPDNKNIPRVKNAGELEGDYLIMHNGLKVDPLSYYGLPALKVLIDNKGVHEPQEEYVFQEVLKVIPENSVMLELGSYWSFYSMWFYKQVKGATCFMIEPELANMKIGQKNFEINNMSGNFYQAYVTNRYMLSRKGERYIGVDDFMKLKNIDRIDLLHCDIQGFEVRMLEGAVKAFEQKKIGYVFISTHSNEKHNDCLSFLSKYNFGIIAEANLNESYSVDGIIVAKAPFIKGIDKVSIAKRTSVNPSLQPIN